MLQSLEVLKAFRPEDAYCPACGHDWDTRGELDTALERTLAEISQSAKEAASQRATLQKQEQTLVEKQVARAALEARATQLGKQRNALAQADNDITGAAKPFGLEAVDSPHAQTMARWEYQIEVAEWLERLDATEQRPFESFPQPALNESPSDWLAKLRADALDRRSVISRLSNVVSELDAALSNLEGQLKEYTLRLEQLRSRIASAKSEQRKVSELARQLGIESVDLGSLVVIRSVLTQEADDIRRAGSLLVVRKRALEAQSGQSESERLANELVPIRACIDKLEEEQRRCAALSAIIRETTSQMRKTISAKLSPTVSQLFQRMQVNRVFSDIRIDDSLNLAGILSGIEMDPSKFSAGQRQDLALAFFLARSYAIGGSFFLDEPLAHLDDINRVALLDTLRAFVLAVAAHHQQTRLTITTASWLTARHLIEKFIRVDRDKPQAPSLRVYQLRGNVDSGVIASQVYPPGTGTHSQASVQ